MVKKACVVKGGMHGEGSACVVKEGVHGEGACMARGACVTRGRVWQERRPLQHAVRILLECILVGWTNPLDFPLFIFVLELSVPNFSPQPSLPDLRTRSHSGGTDFHHFEWVLYPMVMVMTTERMGSNK